MNDARAARPLDVDALYARHREPLLAWFVRRTADTQVALDLWAETFAQAVAGRRRFRGRTEDEAAGWLYGIARRQLALYHLRGAAERRALRRLGVERPPADEALIAEVERRAGLGALRDDLAAALAGLSAPVREAVRLRVIDELDYPDVAGRLGISEPAARARVSRGLLALAGALDTPTIKEALSP
ncbi:MAG TPA: RNA polymerase sigma factor [Solirubrobacteraceae bacterium]|jgi:RNA polymerase sigma-70 factor (ECF subfamily)|nr:RNA polymerase sigma factor [Solirubrobacteraceae bacterium]